MRILELRPMLFSKPHDKVAMPTLGVESQNGWLVVFVASVWVLAGLIGHDPWKPDEAYTFGIVYHINLTGDWVVPILGGSPFMEKPPLFFAVAALFGRLFGSWLPLYDGARLAAGFFDALTLVFTGLAAKELFGKGRGLNAVLVLIGCLGLVVRAHQMITDTALLAGFACAFHGFTLERRRTFLAGVLAGTGVGVAFMSKGLLAPGVFGLLGVALPLLSQRWRRGSYGMFMLVAALTCLPWLAIWPAMLYVRSPGLFQEWFWVNNIGRFVGFAHLGPGSEHAFYFRTLAWAAWPALPLAAWLVVRRRKDLRRDDALRLPLALFLIIFIVLSAAADQRELYALPLFVPLSVLAGGAIPGMRRWFSHINFAIGLVLFGLLALALWIAWAALMTGWPHVLSVRLHRYQPGFDAHLRPLAVAVAVGFSVIWLLLVRGYDGTGRRAILVWSGGLTLGWVLLATLWLPFLNAGKSYRTMMLALGRHLPVQYNCLASKGLGEPQRAMLDYYLGVITVRKALEPEERCPLFLQQGWADQVPKMGPAWHLLWSGNRPGDHKERFWLYDRLVAKAKDERSPGSTKEPLLKQEDGGR